MSRERDHEVSSPISLFPFIGILLCTMGALLVVLVAVSRSARTTAERQVATKQKQGAQVAAQPANDDVHRKLDELAKYDSKLGEVHQEAERRLRDEQVRLGNVEDHIRRLREKMETLNLAAVELEELQGEHYDDRKQAEREIGRLHQLIGDAKKTIESMRADGNKAKRSYAVVPFKGENGTYRRPIYIECTERELILQPEGVRLSGDELRSPLGPGNPLATALRAAREHLIRMDPQIGTSRDTEPYPLLLIRPNSHSYPGALEAIIAGDFEVGMELVESDWKLKFPPADPQLAGVLQQALDQARARQKLLAAAAPRAYKGESMTAAGDFNFDEDDDGGAFSSTDATGGSMASRRRGARTYTVPSGRSTQQERSGKADEAGRTANDGASNSGGLAPAPGNGPGGNGAAPGANAPGGNLAASSGAAGTGGTFGSGGGSAPPTPVGDKNLVPEGFESQKSASAIAGTPAPPGSRPSDAPAGPRSERERGKSAENRGKDWALKQKPGESVPVRRTIRVQVENGQLTILADSGTADAGTVVKMQGDTVETIDEFVKGVREHIDGWGIAGTGLYWRPVVMLNVAPDGQRRAEDLARLLKNSGLDLRTDETARNLPQGSTNETR
jgi:hypothetical protein